MGTVSITQLANGTTADATTVDNNFNAIANAVNGNLDSTNLAANAIGDGQLATSVSPVTFRKEAMTNFVASGLTIATSASLSSTITSGVAYVNGKRIAFSSTPITVTASKDTYVYLKDDGTIDITGAVTNNASSPAAITNSDSSKALLLAILVSSGTAITLVNQGAFNATGPTVSSIVLTLTDTNGNMIYPTSPNPVLIGYRQITTDFATATTADITGLNTTVIIPTGRRYRVVAWVGGATVSTANNAGVMNVIDVTASNTILATVTGPSNASGDAFTLNPVAYGNLSGTRTFKSQLGHGNNAVTTHTNSSSVNPSFIAVYLEA